MCCIQLVMHTVFVSSYTIGKNVLQQGHKEYIDGSSCSFLACSQLENPKINSIHQRKKKQPSIYLRLFAYASFDLFLAASTMKCWIGLLYPPVSTQYHAHSRCPSNFFPSPPLSNIHSYNKFCSPSHYLLHFINKAWETASKCIFQTIIVLKKYTKRELELYQTSDEEMYRQ